MPSMNIMTKLTNQIIKEIKDKESIDLLTIKSVRILDW